MAIAQPILGGTTLPHVSEFSESGGYRGGFVILANGGISFDVVNTVYKRTFSLSWRGLTLTQKNLILTKYAAIMSASATFTPPEGSATTVTRSDQQQELEWKATSVGGGTTLLWETTMLLREV